MNVEMLWSCIDLDQYPAKDLDALWKKLLINQFHDIILLEGSREAMGMVILSIEDNFIADPKLLQNLKIPTLILHGEKDKLVDISFTNHFLEQIPNVKLISYPKVGHMPPMEIPEKLAYDIKSFLGT